MPTTTLVHLSDLHFGRIDPTIVAALQFAIRDLSPDLVIVSGDLTQRGRRRQFLEARQFLDQLPCPRLIVAGNHDVPLHRPILRFSAPLYRFRRLIEPMKSPVWDNGMVCVVGINTARAITLRPGGFWKDGAVSNRAVREAVRIFASSLAPYRIVVTHHPLMVADAKHLGDIARNGTNAIGTLATFGVELFLYGHLHVSHILQAAIRVGEGPPHRIVGVMAGTCSQRTRGQQASYNVIRIEHTGYTIESHVWSTQTLRFDVSDSQQIQSQRMRINPARRHS